MVGASEDAAYTGVTESPMEPDQRSVRRAARTIISRRVIPRACSIAANSISILDTNAASFCNNSFGAVYAY